MWSISELEAGFWEDKENNLWIPNIWEFYMNMKVVCKATVSDSVDPLYGKWPSTQVFPGEIVST